MQKPLLTEDFILKRAYEMATSMEAASKRASKLHASTRVNGASGTSNPDNATAGTAQYVGRKPTETYLTIDLTPPATAVEKQTMHLTKHKNKKVQQARSHRKDVSKQKCRQESWPC